MTIETSAPPRSGGKLGKLSGLMKKRVLNIPVLYWTAGAVLVLALVAWKMKPASDGTDGKKELADTGDATAYDAEGNPLPGTGGLSGFGPYAPSPSGGSGAGSEPGLSGGGDTSVGTPLPPPEPLPAEPEPVTAIEIVDTAPERTNETYLMNAIEKYTARGYSETQVRSYLSDYLSGRDMSASASLFVQKVLREMGTPPSPPAKVGKYTTATKATPATVKPPAVMSAHQQRILTVANALASGRLNTTAAKAKYGAAAVAEAKTKYPAAAARANAPKTAVPVKAAPPIASSKTVTAPKVAAPTAAQAHVAHVAKVMADLNAGRKGAYSQAKIDQTRREYAKLRSQGRL